MGNFISLNYTTDNTKKIIKEAIRLYKNNEDFCCNGWEYIGDGSFKQVYIKANVVVKFGPEEQLIAEYDRWKNFSRSYLRKYLARVYAIIDDKILIQKRVNDIKDDECYCSKAKHIAKLIGFKYDWMNNHGHEKDMPIFFDVDEGWI